MKVLIHYLVKFFVGLCVLSSVASAESGAKRPQVVLETTAGNITLELLPEVAPKAVENFIGLVDKGYYNGTIFHRTIRKFMIQGGDPTGTGMGGESLWGEDFADEIAKGYAFDKAGILAMANSGPNTNGSQFFITTSRASHLNGKHTIFGYVVEGMDNVRRIEYSPTDSKDKPLKEQKIIKAWVVQ